MSNASVGKWVSPEHYNPRDICSICQEDLGTQQAIYKTPCNHFFHNNCIDQYCNIEGKIDQETGQFTLSCPICRSKWNENVCNDVWAFQEKALGQPLPFENNPHILQIYEQQSSLPPQQGGRSRKAKRKTNKRKRKTKKRKTRRNKKTNKRR